MKTMRAMLLDGAGRPLRPAELPIPTPGPGQVLLKVQACGVCHTDLHIVDGELTGPKLPLVLGHQIVGIVAEPGAGAGAPRAARQAPGRAELQLRHEGPFRRGGLLVFRMGHPEMQLRGLEFLLRFAQAVGELAQLLALGG